MVVWLGMINNPNGTVGWGLSRNEWPYWHLLRNLLLYDLQIVPGFLPCIIAQRQMVGTVFESSNHGIRKEILR